MVINAALIGAGIIGEGHLADLQTTAGVEVRAIADPNAVVRDQQAAKFGVPVQVSDYHELLDDNQIDVGYVCVPHFLHLPITVDLLKAGKHVVCEKPFAMNAVEARQMIETSIKSGRKLFIAENHRFFPQNIKAREILEKGTIGRSYLATTAFIGDELERMNAPDNWKGTKEKSGGGVIIDNGFHAFDTLVSFLGRASSVQVCGGRLLVEAANKAEDTATINLVFESGAVANVALTFAARHCGFPAGYIGAGLRYDLYGSNGALHLVNEEDQSLILTSDTGATTMARQQVQASLLDDVPIRMNQHFIECILNDTEPIVTLEQQIHIVQIVDACYRSLETGKTERVRSE